jgi:hypothetical protein
MQAANRTVIAPAVIPRSGIIGLREPPKSTTPPRREAARR